MGELERFTMWLVYTGALEAQKLSKFRSITSSSRWKTQLREVAIALSGFGLVL